MSFAARNSVQEAHDGKLQAAAVFTAFQSALTSEHFQKIISFLVPGVFVQRNKAHRSAMDP